MCLHNVFFYICRTIDAEAQTHLQNLKTDVMNEANVHKFTIPWSSKGIDPQFQPHSKYLEEFCETFRSSIIDMIDKSLKSRSKVENQAVAQFYEEMLHHASFCAKKCRYANYRGKLKWVDPSAIIVLLGKARDCQMS